MKIVFHTDNLDKVFYSQIIHTYLSQLIFANALLYEKYKKDRDRWRVHIYPTKDWKGIDGRSGNTGTLNPNIPHGLTGDGVVECFILDVNDKGLTSLQNFSAILHEVAHMYLIITMRGERGVLRNDDLGGNRKGKSLNVSTQEVHDRQQEGKFYQIQTWINTGSWIKKKWTRYTFVGLDFRDFLGAKRPD